MSVNQQFDKEELKVKFLQKPLRSRLDFLNYMVFHENNGEKGTI